MTIHCSQPLLIHFDDPAGTADNLRGKPHVPSLARSLVPTDSISLTADQLSARLFPVCLSLASNRRCSLFQRQSLGALAHLWFAPLFVFQSTPEDRLAPERDIKAPEKQNERSQQSDHGAPSVPLVENQWW